MPLGSSLLCASLIWSGLLLKRPRWSREGSKGSLGGILMSHAGPSLSHLCGGCKAPEQVDKPLTLKIPAPSQELWPAVSLKPIFPPALLNKIIPNTYTHSASGHVCQVVWTQSAGVPGERFFHCRGPAGCRTLPGVEQSGCSPGAGASPRHCVRVLKQEEVTLWDLKYVFPTAHLKSLLAVIYFAPIGLNGPDGSSVVRAALRGGLWDESRNGDCIL